MQNASYLSLKNTDVTDIHYLTNMKFSNEYVVENIHGIQQQ